MNKKWLVPLLILSLMPAGCGRTGQTASDTEKAAASDTVQQEEETAAADQTVRDTETAAQTEAADGYGRSLEYTDGDIPMAVGEIFAMDTHMTLAGYGEQSEAAVDAAMDEIERLDRLLSVGNSESEIFTINETGQGPLSEDTLTLLDCAMNVYESTGGAYDITIYPLMQLWGFTSGDYRVPDQEEISETLAQVGTDLLTLDRDNSSLDLGGALGIDLGGIVKGYASSRIMDIFEAYGLESGMVNLGGNAHFYRSKPDGSLWRVGIMDPLAPDGDDYLGIVSLSDRAVITSGGYERYFTDEETGETYHHILDPATGYPAKSGLISVSVVSGDGMLADALSTACYVMGLEKSLAYWQAYGEDFDLVLMTEDEEVYITEGLEGSFDSDYPVHVIYAE